MASAGSSGSYADSFSSMASMDEYSTRDLFDFSDLALEDSATDIALESTKEGLAGVYAKANYEVCAQAPPPMHAVPAFESWCILHAPCGHA